MKNIWKFTGKFFLSIAALIIVAGPASLGSIAVEEVPESIKNNR